MAFLLTEHVALKDQNGNPARCSGCVNPARRLLTIGPFVSSPGIRTLQLPICRRCIPLLRKALEVAP